MRPAPPPLPAVPKANSSSSRAAWVSVLQNIGWPTDIIVLDWETYYDSDYQLRKISTIEYIEDERFEELGVSTLLLPGQYPHSPRKATFWTDIKGQLTWFQTKYGENLERCVVVGHNLRFDGTILARKYGIVPPYVIDTLSLSRHLDARNRHSLEILCNRWGLPPKGDTSQFLGLHLADMTLEQQRALAKYANNDVERTLDLFTILLPKLTRPEVELPLMRHTLRLFWEPELALDFDLAEELRTKMQAQVAKDTEPVGLTPKELRSNKVFVSALNQALDTEGKLPGLIADRKMLQPLATTITDQREYHPPAEPETLRLWQQVNAEIANITCPMKMGKNKMIPALAKDDPAVTKLRRHSNPRVRELIKARLCVKSWPLHIRRVESMVAQATAAGGRLCNPLNYYGAHTGRWSGGEGINTANLPTRGGGLQCEIKHCLIAPERNVFILADAAQIEARGLAWIARQMDLIEAFAQDRDIYSDFASETLASPCRKPQKTDPPPVAKIYSTRRAIGKVGILGMGYGMGAPRALDYMETYPELRPKVEAGEIDLAFCKRFVNAYRNKYRMIPKFWRDLENVFSFVTRHGGTKTLRNLTMSREGTTTTITLPSGRTLFYPHATTTRDGDLQYRWGRLWGGTLTENIVQAMSRDILAEAILYVEERGFRVAHHVYDSIVASVPQDQADLAYKCVCEALTRQPEWAPDWPMGVEASIGTRYE